MLILSLALVKEAGAQDIAPQKGRETFMTYCARCHGVNGGGGEGPALNRTYLPRASNDTAFAQVIAWGIPGTAMPGLWMLSRNQISQVIRYVRSLGTVQAESIKGDPQKGLVIFQKSNCLSCHSINAKGNSVGPDLSGVGMRRGSTYIQEVITNPGKQKVKDENGFIQFLVIEVTTNEGKTIRGIRMNEDTYTIQMKDIDNNLYSFRKERLTSIKRYPEASLMPSFDQKLTNEEKQDLVAYLLTQK